jgi:hypothetical protein
MTTEELTKRLLLELSRYDNAVCRVTGYGYDTLFYLNDNWYFEFRYYTHESLIRFEWSSDFRDAICGDDEIEVGDFNMLLLPIFNSIFNDLINDVC